MSRKWSETRENFLNSFHLLISFTTQTTQKLSEEVFFSLLFLWFSNNCAWMFAYSNAPDIEKLFRQEFIEYHLLLCRLLKFELMFFGVSKLNYAEDCNIIFTAKWINRWWQWSEQSLSSHYDDVNCIKCPILLLSKFLTSSATLNNPWTYATFCEMKRRQRISFRPSKRVIVVLKKVEIGRINEKSVSV